MSDIHYGKTFILTEILLHHMGNVITRVTGSLEKWNGVVFIIAGLLILVGSVAIGLE